ncbi:RDD family protein [Coleofasciculus chthonoplastes]|uniref:RDD family protein n=1 Tax=Coleofasciculus chthonoplastes TaxID=64178 RepID=UPI0032FCE5A7
MNPAKIKKLAKQGDPEAIAVLLNGSLQRQGVTAKVGRENNNLQVILESAQMPPIGLTQRICKGLINLGVESIERVQIYGRQTGEEIPDWSQDIDLANSIESNDRKTDASTSSFTQISQNSRSYTNDNDKAKTNQHIASISKTAQTTDNQSNNLQSDWAPEPKPVFKLASRKKRFRNYIFDMLFYMLASMIVGYLIAKIQLLRSARVETEEFLVEIEPFKNLIGYLITFIYYSISESIWSKSPAKFITKTKVVNNRNEKPSFGQIIGRTAARFIPFETFSFLSSKHPRGWHDKISGTKVVDDPIQS